MVREGGGGTARGDGCASSPPPAVGERRGTPSGPQKEREVGGGDTWARGGDVTLPPHSSRQLNPLLIFPPPNRSRQKSVSGRHTQPPPPAPAAAHRKGRAGQMSRCLGRGARGAGGRGRGSGLRRSFPVQRGLYAPPAPTENARARARTGHQPRASLAHAPRPLHSCPHPSSPGASPPAPVRRARGRRRQMPRPHRPRPGRPPPHRGGGPPRGGRRWALRSPRRECRGRRRAGQPCSVWVWSTCVRRGCA